MDKPTDLIHIYDGSMDDLPAFLRPGWKGATEADEQQPTSQDKPDIYAQVRIIGIGAAGSRSVAILKLGRISALAEFLVLDNEDKRLSQFVVGADLVIIIASLNEANDGLAQWATKISKDAGAITLRYSADLPGDMPDAHTVFATQMEQLEFLDACVTYFQDELEDGENGACRQTDPISFHAVANLVTAVNVQGVICVDYADIRAVFDRARHARFAHVLAAAGADPAMRLEQVLKSGQLSRDMAVAKRILVAMSAPEWQSPSLETVHKVINVVRRHCRDDAYMIFSMNELTECAPGTFSVGIYTVEN